MAQKTVFTDDIDNSPDAQTVRFSLDGKAYEIDLSRSNLEALRAALQPYVEAARRVSGQPRRATTAKDDVDLNAVRVWAKENGIKVSDRGRLPTRVVEAYGSR